MIDAIITLCKWFYALIALFITVATISLCLGLGTGIVIRLIKLGFNFGS